MTKKKLANHQRLGISELHKRNVGLFFEPRTGKSATLLAYICDRIRTGDVENALIICPASLVPSWALKIDEMATFEGYTPADVDALRSCVTIRSFGKAKGNVPKRMYRLKPSFVAQDLQRPWDVIAIDESHGLGDYRSGQTKCCMALGLYFGRGRRALLTGTPDGGRFEKLYGQIMFLDPYRWARHADYDKQMIAEVDYFGNPKSYNTAFALELKKQYGIVARLKDCFDLPPILDDEIIPCDMTKESWRVYKDMEAGKFEQYGIDFLSSNVRSVKMLQSCSGSLKYGEGGQQVYWFPSSKEQALKDILDGTDEPIVIFALHTATLHKLARVCEAVGREPIIYDGEAPPGAWQAFQGATNGPDTILCQYRKGGVGIELHRARLCIFAEPTGSSIDHIQARARIYGPDQTLPVSYIYLVSYAPTTKPELRSTIESVIFERMRAGKDTSDMQAEQIVNDLAYMRA